MQIKSTGWIFDIQRFSLHNGPGIRTSVFLKGCPLNCWWCHNPESQASRQEMAFYDTRCIHCGDCIRACPQGAISLEGGFPLADRTRCQQCGACARACYSAARQVVGEEIDAGELISRLQRDFPFFDQSGGGITISGGEPLMQPEFLRTVLQGCKASGMHTALDTSGYAAWEALDSLRDCVDLFLYDVKLMDDTLHRKFTGVSNEIILRNLRLLSEHACSIILRVPIIPGVNDDLQNLSDVANLAHSLSAVQRVDLLPYHTIAAGKYRRTGRDYHLTDLQTPSPARMEEIMRLFQTCHLPVSIGG